MHEVACHYCSQPAMLSFDENGICYYVCSAEHYHLHFRKQFEQAIKHYETTQTESRVVSAMPTVSSPEIAKHVHTESSKTTMLQIRHKQIGALNG